MRPDFGEHMQSLGFAGKQLEIINVVVLAISAAPNDTRDVGFVVEMDGERFVGTLNTTQQRATLLRLMRQPPLAVSGRLATELTQGDVALEKYRLIHGVLKSVP
jgi:hypothetical protein